MQQGPRYVLVFGNKWQAAERVALRGYIPVVFHHDKVSTEHFLHLTPEEAVACHYDRGFVEQFPPRTVVGCIVTSEYYVELAARIREEFFPALPGLTLPQAELVRDKLCLKQTLMQLDIPCARFAPLGTYDNLCSLLGRPFLVKPRRGAMTEGLVTISSPDEWTAWVDRHTDHERYYAEEYVHPVREYCCDTIVADGQVLAQFPGEYTVNCLNFRRQQCGVGVDYPGFAPPAAIDELNALTRKFIAHSRIANGFFHTEFFYTAEGWKFSEVGCRLPGALQLPAESAMAGVDLLDLYLNIFITTEPTPTTPLNLANRYYGYYLYPLASGRITAIESDFHHPWIVEGKVYHQVGDLVHTDMSNFFAGHVIYRAENLDTLGTRAQQAPALLRVTSTSAALNQYVRPVENTNKEVGHDA